MSLIAEFFAEIETDDRWFHSSPFSDEDVEELLEDLEMPLPDEVKEILLAVGTGEWAGDGPHIVVFFDDIAMRDVNETLTDYIPGTFAFGSDGGPLWYAIDTENALGNGAGTVWSVPAGAPYPDEARRVADGIPEFLRWMIEQD